MSFCQAARDLALSQEAVSKRVRALEQTLRVALLIRNRHEVRLSETGRRFLTEVTRLLVEFDATTQAFVAVPPTQKAVSVGLPRAVAAYWLLPRLLQLRARHPDLRVNLVALSGRERPDAALDAVIEESAETPPADALLLWEERLVPVAAPAVAALAAAEGLGAIDRLHLARRPDLWARWSALGSVPAGPDGATHDGLSLVIDAAIRGHGAALVPEVLAAGPIAEGRLARLDGAVTRSWPHQCRQLRPHQLQDAGGVFAGGELGDGNCHPLDQTTAPRLGGLLARPFTRRAPDQASDDTYGIAPFHGNGSSQGSIGPAPRSPRPWSERGPQASAMQGPPPEGGR